MLLLGEGIIFGNVSRTPRPCDDDFPIAQNRAFIRTLVTVSNAVANPLLGNASAPAQIALMEGRVPSTGAVYVAENVMLVRIGVFQAVPNRIADRFEGDAGPVEAGKTEWAAPTYIKVSVIRR